LSAVRAEAPLSLPLDAVHFSITAPLAVAPDSSFELNFWAHREEQREDVLERAKRISALSADFLFRSEGPFELPRGSRLSIRISVPEFNITPDEKPLLWVGEIATAAFIVHVSPDAQIRGHAGRASVRLNGLQIATLDFLLHVAVHTPPVVGPILTHTNVHTTAFASYASEDRDHVLARIQGMEAAAKHLKVFVDVVNLRSGQLWEQELWRVIPESDVFYLFWCRHAKRSDWVDKEWRCALDKRGLDFIDPVPLEPARFATPPKELAAKFQRPGSGLFDEHRSRLSRIDPKPEPTAAIRRPFPERASVCRFHQGWQSGRKERVSSAKMLRFIPRGSRPLNDLE
jgi:hypothetical protein